MLTLVLFKLVGDLGLYYALAGFFALLAGAQGPIMAAILALQVLSGVLCCALRQRKRLRFAPLALMLFGWVICGSLAAAIVAVPPAVYTVWIVAAERYFPDQDRQIDIFSAAWKILLGFCFFVLLFGGWTLLGEITIPVGVAALTCCVLLNRSLRHDPAVCCRARFQAVNLAVAAGVTLCGAVLGSEAFLRGCVSALQWFYMHLILPVLEGLLYLLLKVFQFFQWLFSWVHFQFTGREQEAAEMDMTGAEDIFEGVEVAEGSGVWAGRIAWILVAAAAVVLIVLFFRWLSRRSRGQGRSGDSTVTTRSAAAPRSSTRARSPLSRSPVDRVRAQYRKYLKLYCDSGFPLETGDTSLDVCRRSRDSFDPDAAERLRKLYLAARYADRAEEADAAEARELVQKLKKSGGS